MNRYAAVLFDLFGTLVDDRGDAIAGARELLAAFDGKRFAIVTSAPRRLARALIERAELPEPPVLVCADDVEHGKPAPECYVLGARRLAVEPVRCLVIEDSEAGIAAAADAGMEVIAVRRGRGSDFARRATRSIDRLGDLRLRGAPEGFEVL